MMADARFPTALAAALRERRMSKAELARRVGIGRCSVGDYVAGKAVPRRETLRKINELLGVDLSAVKSYTAAEVAKLLGTSKSVLGMAMRNGKFAEIGVAVQLPCGKYRYVFYPAKVREFCGE